MSNIERARGILEAHRIKAQAAGPQNRFLLGTDLDDAVKPVILLTAANRDFLNSVDVLLLWAQVSTAGDKLRVAAEDIALAIIAADEKILV